MHYLSMFSTLITFAFAYYVLGYCGFVSFI